MNWRCAAAELRLALALVLLAPGVARAQELTRGPYLVAATATSAEVCWRASGLQGCRVLRGLRPGEEFSYEVPGSPRRWRARALPGPSSPLRFAVFGDSGSGEAPQWRVAGVLERSHPQLVLVLGDIVYPRGADDEYDQKFFAPYGPLLSRVPFFTAPGNHDYGNHWFAGPGQRRFEEAYRRVHDKPKYYSFDAGPAHFVSLDDNEADYIAAAAPIGPGSEQRAWLERDLAASRAPWKIVFLHVPLYTSTAFHGDNDYLRRWLEPLFRRYGVQVVFQGHDHLYERSRPIGGIVYVTAGSGGADLHRSPRKAGADWVSSSVLSYGLVEARLDLKSLHLEFIDDQGRVRDAADIPRTP